MCVGNMTGVRRVSVRCSLCEGLRTTELQTAHLYRGYAGPQPVPCRCAMPLYSAHVFPQCTVHCTLYTHTLQPASQGQEFFAPWQMSFLFHLISSDRFKDEWRNSKDFSKQKSTLQIEQSVPSLYPETLCKSLTTPMCVTICDSDYQDHGQTFILNR